MKKYTLKVTCPLCNATFKGDVLSDYEISGYDYDFMPLFKEGTKLLDYYIWFCPTCHYAGYDNRFSFEKYTAVIPDEIREILLSIPKHTVTLSYKFYRAGVIAEIFGESDVSLLDYFMKSYWAAKRDASPVEKEEAAFKIMEVADRIIKAGEFADNEHYFIALYLSGLISTERGQNDEAAFFFSRLMSMKMLPASYKKHIAFATAFLREHHCDS